MTIDVSRVNGNVAVDVTDDGVGGADAAGAGLSGLRDRVEALDGRLVDRQPPGPGNTSHGGHPVRVILADDAVVIREGLARLLTEQGIEVTATAGTAEDLLRLVATDPPDVAIIDIRMPPTYTNEGLVAAQQIRSAYPEVATLVLSQYVEVDYALQLMTGKSERVGYLLKDRIANIADFEAALAQGGRRRRGGRALARRASSLQLPQRAIRWPSSPRASGRYSRWSGKARPTAASPKSSSCPARPSKRTSAASLASSTFPTTPARTGACTPCSHSSNAPAPVLRAARIEPSDSPTRVPAPPPWLAASNH